MSNLRLAVRLARREMGRRPWRTALVLLMVLVPTALMTLGATLLRTGERTAEERRSAEVGQADLLAYPFVPPPGAAAGPWAGAGVPPPVMPAEPVPPAQVTAAGVPPPVPVTPAEPLPPAEVTDASVAALRAALPAGSRVLVEHGVQDRRRDGERRTYFTLGDVDLASPVVQGRFRLLTGRLAGPDGTEAVVSEDLADELGLAVGDRLRSERLGRDLAVVGTVGVGWQGNWAVAPGSLTGVPNRWSTVYVDLPGRPFDGVGEARAAASGALPAVEGWRFSPVVAEADTRGREVFWTYVGGVVALAVLGTVIAAAFAVAARRQLRTLGLLSSAGASPRTLRWLLVAQGAATGVVGSVAGVAVGLAAAAAAPESWLRSVAGHHVDGLVVRPGDLVPVVVIGALAASVAAWLPARSISTVPTLAALAGRRPLGVVPARLPLLGALAVGAGCALFAMAVAGTRGGSSAPWALVAIAGGLSCLFGALAVCPWVVAALERMGGRWPQSWRLAARSLARSRVRSSAVVGAVVAVSAALVAGTTLFASFRDDGEGVPWLAANQIRIERLAADPGAVGPSVPAAAPHGVVDRARALVPHARRLEVLEVGSRAAGGAFAPALAGLSSPDDLAGGAFFSRHVGVAIATPELLALFGVPGDARAALARGEAVVLGGDERPATVWLAPNGDMAADPVRLPAAGPVGSDQAAESLPRVLLAEETARAHDLTWRRSPVVTLIAPEPLTGDERRDLRQLSEDVMWEQSAAGADHVQVLAPDQASAFSPGRVRAAGLALAFALVAVVVAVGLALAARDSEDERQVLTAVGAPPAVLRRVATLRAALLVGAAAVVAVPAGLLPAAAIVEAATSPGSGTSLRVDSPALLFVLVAVPVLVGALVSVAAAVRDRLRPPRADVFAFGE